MNTDKMTKENQQNIAVTSAIHAQASMLARRDGMKMYQVIARALDLYQRVYPFNGDTEPQE